MKEKNKFLLAGGKFTSEMHLTQPRKGKIDKERI